MTLALSRALADCAGLLFGGCYLLNFLDVKTLLRLRINVDVPI